MKKIITKIISSVLTIFLVISVPAFAVDNINNTDAQQVQPRYVGTTTDHIWKHEVMYKYEEEKGGWNHFYTGYPAGRDGERTLVSGSTSYSHTFSGTIYGSLKKKIETSVGYTFNITKKFTISQMSGFLGKGEYIKAYYCRNYDVSKVKQKETLHIYGWEQGFGGQYHKVDRYESGKTCYMYAKKALKPKIRLDYWKDGHKVRSINNKDILLKTEYYEYINGEYKLVEE
jgi:hypothetical protein